MCCCVADRNYALPLSTIQSHYVGNYANQLSLAAGLLMWLPFSEGAGNTATDVIQGNVFTWQGGAGWSNNTNANVLCLPGFCP
jgi:hypothetical protein